MKLLLRFNLILLLLFGTAGVVVAYIAHGFLNNSARTVVLQQAELMMASAQAVRDYTDSNVKKQLTSGFHPEAVPNFAAITTFQIMKKRYPEYIYTETAMNPRNPEHRALDWEAEVISWLRDHRDKAEVSNELDTATERVLYLARPIKMEIECMECHSTPDAAPAELVAHYGNVNGFGWQEGDEIIGAQIVTVPMTVPVQIANQAFRGLLIYLVVTLLVTMLALDASVYWFVIRPLEVVSNTANRVSRGEKDVPALPVKGKDEIAKVTAAFNRMKVSLEKALKMLE